MNTPRTQPRRRTGLVAHGPVRVLFRPSSTGFCFARRWLCSCRVRRNRQAEAYFGIYRFAWPCLAWEADFEALASRGPTPSADRPMAGEAGSFPRSKELSVGLDP